MQAGCAVQMKSLFKEYLYYLMIAIAVLLVVKILLGDQLQFFN